MLGYVAVTDHEWFEFLSAQPELDEVNFWRPSDTRTPRQLVPGTPFLFKLRREHGDRIVGFGVFARHDVLPAWLAWEVFEEKNGAESFVGMRRRVERLRHDAPESARSGGDYLIGCLMLSQPVFFANSDWVAPPAEWPANAVQGKAYDLSSGEGARVWEECRRAAARVARTQLVGADVHHEPGPRYGEATLVRPRLGQGTFRAAVIAAYDRACAVTGEHSLPAVEAAHIRPYGEGGEHEVTNGLLLRRDIHRLFDLGYVGVTPEYEFVVSDRLKGDYSNGRSYYPLHGTVIARPRTQDDWPTPASLHWHLKEKYRG